MPRTSLRRDGRARGHQATQVLGEVDAASPAARALALQRSVGNRATAQVLQRVPTAPEVEEDEAEVEEQLELEQEEDGQAAADREQAGKELGEAFRGARGRPEVAEFVMHHLQELPGVEPKPPSKARRLLDWFKRKAKKASDTGAAAGKWVVQQAQAVGEAAGEAVGAAKRSLGQLREGGWSDHDPRVRAQAAEGARHGAAGKTWALVKLVLKPAVEYGAKLAGTAKEVVTAVPGIGLAGSLVGLVVDARSLSSSLGHAVGLHDLLKSARAEKLSPELREALAYARNQKIKKSVKKTLGVIGAGLGIAAAVAALVSNPVGWGLGIAAASIGLSMLVYRLVKKALPSQGKLRAQMADKLLDCLAKAPGDKDRAMAERAVRALKFDHPQALLTDRAKGRELLMRKLASN